MYPNANGCYENPIIGCESVDAVFALAGQSIQDVEREWVGCPRSPYNVRIVDVEMDFITLTVKSEAARIIEKFAAIFNNVNGSRHVELANLLREDMEKTEAIGVAARFMS